MSGASPLAEVSLDALWNKLAEFASWSGGPGFDWYAVALIGLVVGAGELVPRSPDAPARALWSRPAWGYLLLNAGAAVLALVFVRIVGWNFGIGGSTGANAANEVGRTVQVLIAGFGAMVLLRSPFFRFRVGEEEVDVGPGRVLQVFLDAIDLEIRRRRGQERDKAVSSAMSNVPMREAFVSFPTYCFSLMRNVSEEDQKRLGSEISILRAASINELVKPYIVGLLLLEIVGEPLLEVAAASFKEKLGVAAPAPPTIPAPSPAPQPVPQAPVDPGSSHQVIPAEATRATAQQGRPAWERRASATLAQPRRRRSAIARFLQAAKAWGAAPRRT